MPEPDPPTPLPQAYRSGGSGGLWSAGLTLLDLSSLIIIVVALAHQPIMLARVQTLDLLFEDSIVLPVVRGRGAAAARSRRSRSGTLLDK
jgi:hypothetical protein